MVDGIPVRLRTESITSAMSTIFRDTSVLHTDSSGYEMYFDTHREHEPEIDTSYMTERSCRLACTPGLFKAWHRAYHFPTSPVRGKAP